MYIAVDFDGTIVTHEFPDIGKPVPYAIETLKELVDLGHDLILFTMRSGPHLEDAVDFLNNQGVKLYGINVNPSQKSWTTSPKAYAKYYVDDASICCPLIYNENVCDRPYVDWKVIRDMMEEKGIFNAKT